MTLMKKFLPLLFLILNVSSESSGVYASFLSRLLHPFTTRSSGPSVSPLIDDDHIDGPLFDDPNATTIEPRPSNQTHNETLPPTPSNHTTVSPTPAVPDGHNGTLAPHNSTTEPPSPTNHTIAPTPSNHTGNGTTIAPTLAPTLAPHPQNHTNVSTSAPSSAPDDDVVPKMTFWGIVRKTIAWLIIIALSVLLFGACMSHRYRIYFFLRGVWYTILRMRCTQWVFRKLRVVGGGPQVDSGLNTIIFDSEMSDGLLLNENRDE